jgi:hypothetical protein
VCFTNAPAWVGPPDAAIRYRKVGTAAGERKARNSTRRKYIIRADGDAGNSTGRAVRADRRIANRGLRTAETRRPHTRHVSAELKRFGRKNHALARYPGA